MLPVDHPVGVEWLHLTSVRGGADPATLRLYAVKTHVNGRTAVRAELDASQPTDIRLIDIATGGVVTTVTLSPGLWPGPTTADRQQLPGQRTLEDTGLTLTL